MSTPLSQLVKVVHGNGDFSSKLVSLVDREPGAILTKIEGSTLTSQRTYSSVQFSENGDIELNSDMVYTNHSCVPNVVFDMENLEVRVVENRNVKEGDDLTFFYPSTEWDMQQPFDCHCDSDRCLGTIKGAKYMEEAKLREYWLNPHVERLLAKRGSADVNGEAGDESVTKDANGFLKN